MHSLVLFMLVTLATCLAHYRDTSDSRNYVLREEPSNNKVVLVECPTCVSATPWLDKMERCPIKKGNKSYKICMHGTYENEQCGHRLDCYRDANEECTEKREFDNHDKRCRTGYMCNKELGICVGPEGRPDTWQLKLMTIIGRPNDHKTHTVDDGIPFEGL